MTTETKLKAALVSSFLMILWLAVMWSNSVNKISNKMAVEYRRSQIYYYHKHRPIWEILILRIYLLFKFLYEYLKTSNTYSWEIIKLIFMYK